LDAPGEELSGASGVELGGGRFEDTVLLVSLSSVLSSPFASQALNSVSINSTTSRFLHFNILAKGCNQIFWLILQDRPGMEFHQLYSEASEEGRTKCAECRLTTIASDAPQDISPKDISNFPSRIQFSTIFGFFAGQSRG
jgi:hypothetical protein